MESKTCLFLLVLTLASSALSIPLNDTHPTVLPVEVAHDHNAVSGDFPVDEGGQRIHCGTTKDCQDSILGEFSECRGSSCVCVISAHQSDTSKKCLPNRGLGEGCAEDRQCADHGSAACIKYVCTCIAGAETFGDQCWIKKNIGETCARNEECSVTTKDAKCVDGACVCKDGTVPHSDGKHCLPVALNIGDACEESSQCSFELGGSECHNGKCKCLADHHERNKACIKTLYIGDQCGGGIDGECFLPNSFGESRVLCKGTCQCREGYNVSEDKKHCLEPGQKDPGTGGGAASIYPYMASIVTVVTALILTS